MAVIEPKHPALREVYWQEEILELALWRRGEGFDERLTPRVVAVSLGLPREEARAHLERLATQGHLRRLEDDRYGLAPRGEEAGRRLLAGLRRVPQPAPGACGSGCWCATSPIEASRCAEARAG